MPNCYFCKEYTSSDKKDPQSGDLICVHCGKKIKAQGEILHSAPEEEHSQETEEILSEEDDEDYDEDDDYEDYDEEKRRIPTIILVMLAFLTGAALTGIGTVLYFTQKQVNPLPNSQIIVPNVEDDPKIEEDTEEIQPLKENSIKLLLQNGVSLGDTVSEMTILFPSLFALNEEGNHYALFDSKQQITLKSSIDLQHIFFFFNSKNRLESIEYVVIPPNKEEDPSIITDFLAEMSELYDILEVTEDYYLWQASDGFIGFSTTQYYLHLSTEEEKIRTIFTPKK